MIGPCVLVDNEVHIRRLLKAVLERGGYRALKAVSAREALELVAREAPEVVVLDLGLPDRDRLELVPVIRGKRSTALLVISAREATDDKVAALDLGADDYVTKPFDSEELLARVRAAPARQAGG